jgi:carbonic anhydrase
MLVHGASGAANGAEQHLALGVEGNVRWTMRRVRAYPESQAALAEGRVKLVGAVYDIATGRVRPLG